MDENIRAANLLTEQSIEFRLFTHNGPVKSLEQAAVEREQRPNQVIRSILFRMSDKIFVLVMIAGPSQISWPKLRSYLGQSRLTLATESEVLNITGYRVGTVTPLGVLTPVRILADENVFTYSEISIGSGVSGTAIIMKAEDLKRILTIEVGSFSTIQ